MDSTSNHDTMTESEEPARTPEPVAESVAETPAAETPAPLAGEQSGTGATESGETTAAEGGIPTRRGPRPDLAAPPPRSANAATLWIAALLIVLGLGIGAGVYAYNQHSHKTTSSTLPTAGPQPTQPAPATPVVTGGSVAAVVNGHKIPMSTYRTYLNFAVRRSAGAPGASTSVLATQSMNQIISDELAREYAASHGITLTTAELNKDIATFTAQQGGAARASALMRQLGLTTSQFRLLYAASILDQKVTQRVAVVPEAHARHILIGLAIPGRHKRTAAAAHALAQQVLQKLQHGGNFAALAKKYSDDTSSGAKGGDLGAIYPGEMVPQFNNAVFHQPLNVPQIVKTQYGYHIIEVLSRTSHAKPPTDPQTKQAYQQAQGAQFQAWVKAQIKHASIQRLAHAKVGKTK